MQASRGDLQISLRRIPGASISGITPKGGAPKDVADDNRFKSNMDEAGEESKPYNGGMDWVSCLSIVMFPDPFYNWFEGGLPLLQKSY